MIEMDTHPYSAEYRIMYLWQTPRVMVAVLVQSDRHRLIEVDDLSGAVPVLATEPAS